LPAAFPDKLNRPQIKICGITSRREALACAAAGADALGFVTYPKSPRYLDHHAIRRICSDLPENVCTVGVFVNERFDHIMPTVEAGGLHAVQLHGQEPPDLIAALRDQGLIVVKALFVDGLPALAEAPHYPADAFLVEAAGGSLPGGNAMVWRWSDAGRVPVDRPVVLAGGLNPDNIREAIAAARPDAVDVSSGVEIRPGRKDPAKVAAFCRNVMVCRERLCRRIFV
jgi:phosphoribosylanthranilate isomerase